MPLREFAAPGQKAELKVGDEVEVYVDRVENHAGEAMLSRDRARREAAWDKLEKEFEKGDRVEGVIFGRVKGGFTVDLGGAVAFLPGSQVDIRPVRDVGPLMDLPQPFQILKMDRRRGNIVVSRRAILEETRAEQRSGLIQSLAEGQVIEGVVKNITDYGAFVDLGGIDGLLHVTDISYKRVGHPSEVINIGDTVKVQIIRINRETQRISLGMKQLESDPWEGAAAKYPVDGMFTGRVTNITEYGAFVELEPGIEGLVHVSEMSWTKKNVHPGKIVSTQPGSRRQGARGRRGEAPDLARPQAGPGQSVGGLRREASGRHRRSRARSRTRPSSACSSASTATSTAWSTCRTSPGACPARKRWRFTTRARRSRPSVLDVDVEKERISLGMKQLERGGVVRGGGGRRQAAASTRARRSPSPCSKSATAGSKCRSATTARPASSSAPTLAATATSSAPSASRSARSSTRMVIGFDRSKKPNFSIKALQIAEEKQAVAQYGSSDSGAIARRHPRRGAEAEGSRQEVSAGQGAACDKPRPPVDFFAQSRSCARRRFPDSVAAAGRAGGAQDG